jgi:ATP-binding cassette subfamily C (CFTR/MRP) protein 1
MPLLSTPSYSVIRSCKQATKEGRLVSLHELPEVDAEDRSAVAAQALTAAWEEEKAMAVEAGREPSFTRLIMRYYRVRLLIAFALRLLQEGSMVGVPFMIRSLVEWLKQNEQDAHNDRGTGYGLAVGLAFVTLLSSLLFGWNTDIIQGVFEHLRAGLTAMVFEKTTNLSSDESSKMHGRITGLHSNDTSKLKDAQFVMAMVSAPFAIIANCVVLWAIAGPPGLVALGVLLLFIPFQTTMSRRMATTRNTFSNRRDRRLQSIADMLHGIRVIKFMGWEPSFAKLLGEQRGAEVYEMMKMLRQRSAVVSASHSLPLLLQLAVFGALYGVDGTLEASKAFPTIAILNQLRALLTTFALSFGKFIDLVVTMRRFETFFNAGSRRVYVRDATQAAAAMAATAFALEFAVPVTVGFIDDGEEDMDMNEKTKRHRGGRRARRAAAAVAQEGGKAMSPAEPFANNDKVQPNEPAGDEAKIAADPPTAAAPEPTTPGKKVPTFAALVPDIHLSIPTGSLTFVIGATASGKSTLVAAMLGEAEPAPETPSDAVVHHVPLVYAAQDAWIMNATVRQNIVMDEPYDEDRYVAAIVCCRLEEDLKMLPAGDHTEIGERGVNLSGGQKQRVALARCAYSSRGLVVLDDPLSAVDPDVGRGLFFDCIRGSRGDSVGTLAGRTRVLVTHHIQYLSYADFIIVMRGCTVAFQGSYDAYIQWKEVNASVAEAIESEAAKASAGGADTPPANPHDHAPHAEEQVAQELSDENRWTTACDRVRAYLRRQLADDEKQVGGGNKGRLVLAEQAEIGSVSWSTIWWFANRGGIGFCFVTLVCFTIWRAAAVFDDMWITTWTARDDAFGRSYDDNGYMMVFGIVAAISILFVLLRQAWFVATMTRASGNSHHELVTAVLRCPIWFFDTTPMGRIMNRFSKDIEAIDTSIPEELNFALNLTMMLAGVFVVMAIAAFPVIPIIVVACVGFGVIASSYASALRSVRRLENLSRSPLVSIMSQFVNGLSTIRPLGAVNGNRERHHKYCDDMMRCVHAFRCVQHWAATAVSICGFLVALAVNIFAVALRSENALAAIRPTGQLAALSVTYGTALNTSLMYYVVITAQLSAQLSAVERVREYAIELPREEDTLAIPDNVDVDEGDDDGNHAGVKDVTTITVKPYGTEPPAPVIEGRKAATAGPDDDAPIAVEFDNVKLRYRPGLPLVLRGVNFAVTKGHRVGVVGRTGSGKSTIMLALFRLVNIASGAVRLNGRDIRTIPLVELRALVTIIPQDPVLFLGSVRTNLDPFNEHSDERMLAVLRQVSLLERLGTDGLKAPVSAKGSNFSVGQRQLLCLARALLRRTDVLLLDEATASVDFETDATIQRIIRTEFIGATTLVIAHRLTTVIDSDMVLVLRDGHVEEYAPPQTLLADPNSVFASMVAVGNRAQNAGN